MLQQQIIDHAKQSGEEESCGFVIKTGQAIQYIPCCNIAPDSTQSFEISTDDWLKASNKGDIVALVHSHPDGIPVLSEIDQLMQQKTALDWWLVCGDCIHQFRLIEPLLGRDFQHGVMDCYSLFRDAYHLVGINLPNFFREDDWWKTEQNLYLENMQKQNFYRIEPQQIAEGDVILVCLGSTTPNHAAIYVGHQQILHHSPNRKSKRDFYNGFWLKYTHSIWRHKQWQPLNFMAILNNMAINLK